MQILEDLCAATSFRCGAMVWLKYQTQRINPIIERRPHLSKLCQEVIYCKLAVKKPGVRIIIWCLEEWLSNAVLEQLRLVCPTSSSLPTLILLSDGPESPELPLLAPHPLDPLHITVHTGMLQGAIFF